ncbi:hypothetical protein V8E53_008666 [Lactarius tabidus]
MPWYPCRLYVLLPPFASCLRALSRPCSYGGRPVDLNIETLLNLHQSLLDTNSLHRKSAELPHGSVLAQMKIRICRSPWHGV